MSEVFRLPDVGEGLTEAEIATWHVAPGDTVTVNQVIVEIETAKALVELPSPFAGTVGELLVSPGDTVAVGTPIIAIETGVPAAAGPAAGTGTGSAAAEGAKIGEAGADGRIATLVGYGPRPGTATRRPRKGRADAGLDHHNGSGPPAETSTVPLAKPPVRKLAKDLAVDLRSLTGSGAGGVITREDVQAAAARGGIAPGAPEPAAGAVARTPPHGPDQGGVRREPVRGVRKATAAAMVSSAFTAPHVTEFLTVDVTATMELRERLRVDKAFADVRVTPLALVAKAVCLAARRTPSVNASWDEQAGEIVYYERVQLGIAAATPRGLIVPRIRDADRLDLHGLAAALGELTETARAGRTAPADLTGGTITITNVGVFGVDTGTPILTPGQAAILAVGSIKQAPWVVDGELAVRTVCQLALSFDHRVVDGEQGSRFLADIGALLQDPSRAILW